jgi:A/G-specific adenine glycosylase
MRSSTTHPPSLADNRLERKLRALSEAVLSGRRKIQNTLLEYAQGHLRTYPWRTGRLSPFKILLYEVLLKRTHADTVAERTHAIVSRFSTPADLTDADETDLERLLEPIGLQRQRARDLKRLALYLVSNERGKVPSDLDRLLRIPGVGPYTARAVLSFGLGKPYAVVDSNVVRVYSRLFRSKLNIKQPKQIQYVADKLLPRAEHRRYNLALLDLGATVCNYGRPKCHLCPLAGVCDTGREVLTTKARVTREPSRRSPFGFAALSNLPGRAQ